MSGTAFPPSKQQVKDLVERFDESTLRTSTTWSQEDMALMVRAYRYQEEVIKDHACPVCEDRAEEEADAREGAYTAAELAGF
jgi:hypothetical protein